MKIVEGELIWNKKIIEIQWLKLAWDYIFCVTIVFSVEKHRRKWKKICFYDRLHFLEAIYEKYASAKFFWISASFPLKPFTILFISAISKYMLHPYIIYAYVTATKQGSTTIKCLSQHSSWENCPQWWNCKDNKICSGFITANYWIHKTGYNDVASYIFQLAKPMHTPSFWSLLSPRYYWKTLHQKKLLRTLKNLNIMLLLYHFGIRQIISNCTK